VEEHVDDGSFVEIAVTGEPHRIDSNDLAVRTLTDEIDEGIDSGCVDALDRAQRLEVGAHVSTIPRCPNTYEHGMLDHPDFDNADLSS
jgi:hypothetical protein